MMQEEEYIDYAGNSLKQGRLPRAMAKRNWDDMKLTYKTDKRAHDLKGPADSTLRLAIAVADKVTKNAPGTP